jgi:molecular chaperone HtpG
MNAHMERIMRAMSQDFPKSKRILELNPDHAVVKQMKDLADENRKSDKLADYIDLLYNQALLTEGSAPKNPTRFAKLVSKLMLEE